jgi:ribosomal protein S18 acetylase RimI-like enzyme
MSGVDVTIRAASAADAEAIARVFLESAEHHAALDPARYAVPPAAAIRQRYHDGRQHRSAGEEAITLIAAIDDEIAGFVDVRLDRAPDPMHREMTYCQVVEIAVSRRHQSRGIGERLLRAAEDWGRQRGATLASLEYLTANLRAGEFYRRAGYTAAAIIAIKRL